MYHTLHRIYRIEQHWLPCRINVGSAVAAFRAQIWILGARMTFVCARIYNGSLVCTSYESELQYHVVYVVYISIATQRPSV